MVAMPIEMLDPKYEGTEERKIAEQEFEEAIDNDECISIDIPKELLEKMLKLKASDKQDDHQMLDEMIKEYIENANE